MVASASRISHLVLHHLVVSPVSFPAVLSIGLVISSRYCLTGTAFASAFAFDLVVSDFFFSRWSNSKKGGVQGNALAMEITIWIPTN
jgi:hypothetical protein